MTEHEELVEAVEHVRRWNELAHEADVQAGPRERDVGRQSTMQYLRAHGRADLEGVA